MATGRHAGYRSNEFRARNVELDVLRKRECYLGRVHEADGEKRHVKEGKFGDLTKREHLNGFRRRDDFSQGRIRSNLVDRETWELYRGIDSNGDRLFSNNKRKFSTIIWNEEEEKSSAVTLGSRKDLPLPDVGPPQPWLMHEKIFRDSSTAETGAVSMDRASEVDLEVFSDTTADQDLGIDHGEDECVTTRNISSSRWAQADDIVLAYEEKHVVGKSGATPLSDILDESPEPGEVISRENSDRAKSNSSQSAREHLDNQEEEDDRNSYMDIDREEADQFQSDHLSGTNSDEEDEMKYFESAHQSQRPINMLQGCRCVDEFEKLNEINEGTYGVVFRAKDKKTGEIVALKKVKMEKEREGFPLTSLREINILLSFHHPSIVNVKGVVTSRDLQNVFLVMEYMEHDLKGLMETMKQPFSQSEVKCLMHQLLLGVKYLHDNWVLHRDLKTSNLLFNNRGELKICDFGLSRQYGSPLKPYTELVVTLWYRSPELLLGAKEYSTAIDMWSLGCIMAELLGKKPLFDGKSEIDQLNKIFGILGNPTPDIWPGISQLPGWKATSLKQKYRYNKLREKFPAVSFSGQPTLSEAGFSLLTKLLTYDPEMRITAEDALNHEWFREIPLPKSKEFMPNFPAQHKLQRHFRRV